MACSRSSPWSTSAWTLSRAFDQEVVVGLQLGPVAQRAVAGDDFGLLISEAEGQFHGPDHALDGAAAVEVDVGVESVEEDVPHVEHVADREVHDAVAVGVAARHVVHGDRLAIEVQRHAVVEGHHRQ